MQTILDWIQRNPLLVLLLLVLLFGAPAIFTGIAIVLLGILALGVVGMAVIAWRFRSLRRQMEDQFRQSSHSEGAYRQPNNGRSSDEGRVRIYTSSEVPEKRLSDDVGDYIEFEETKDR